MSDKEPYELNDPNDPNDPNDGQDHEPSPNANPNGEPEHESLLGYEVNEPKPPTNTSEQATAASPSYVSLTCVACGYNLTGVTIGGKCPECGADVDASLYAAGSAPPNGFAITSLVIGIIALVGACCCWGGFLGVPGLIFGVLAMNQIKTGNYNTASRGMAIAGIICNALGMLSFLGMILLMLIG